MALPPKLATDVRSGPSYVQPGRKTHAQLHQEERQALNDVLDAVAAAPKSGTNPALRTFHTALARRRVAQVNVVTLGSSTPEGYGATQLSRGVMQLLRDRLREIHPVPGVAGGAGLLAAYYTDPNQTGKPLTVNGGAIITEIGSGSGWAHKSVQMTTVGHTITGSFYGTGCGVAYGAYVNGGSFTVSIDGGAPVTVNSNSATVDRFKMHYATGLTRGNHTITIAFSAGQSVYFRGLMVYDQDEDRGIRFWDGARGGTTALQFQQYLAQWNYGITTIQPHLVIMDVGRNDIPARSPGAVKTSLKAIIDGVKAACGTRPSFVLVYAPASQYSGLTDTVIGQYKDVWTSLADEDPNNVCVFDWSERVPSPLVDNSYGEYDGALTHLTDIGHAHMADSLADFLRAR